MSAWILLRGLTREARHWGNFAEQFGLGLGSALDYAVGSAIGSKAGFAGEFSDGSAAVSAMADSSVTLLELPGNGTERGVQAPFSVPGMMTMVRARAAELGIPGPYRLLAMSLGGMVATAWAQRHPQEIERLVLINTSMRPFCNLTQRMRPTAWPVVGRAALAWTNPQGCERRLHDLTCNRRDTAADDIAAWMEIRRTAGVSAANGLRQLWAAARFQADREAPRCPTLLLSSSADRLVDPVCSVRIAAQWHAAHVEHPWAGHDLPHDDPQWTSETIADWLLRLEDKQNHRLSMAR